MDVQVTEEDLAARGYARGLGRVALASGRVRDEVLGARAGSRLEGGAVEAAERPGAHVADEGGPDDDQHQNDDDDRGPHERRA